jgi:hypothetical protein
MKCSSMSSRLSCMGIGLGRMRTTHARLHTSSKTLQQAAPSIAMSKSSSLLVLIDGGDCSSSGHPSYGLRYLSRSRTFVAEKSTCIGTSLSWNAPVSRTSTFISTLVCADGQRLGCGTHLHLLHICRLTSRPGGGSRVLLMNLCIRSLAISSRPWTAYSPTPADGALSPSSPTP